MTQETVFLLAGSGLVVALIAVVLDRLNFPQPKFRAKGVKVVDGRQARDRTGAHIIDVDEAQ